MIIILYIVEVADMTIQDTKTCLFNVYEARKADLTLSREERERFLEEKYPVRDLLCDRAISARMRSALDTFTVRSPDEDYLDAMQICRFSDQLYLEHGLFQEDTMGMREIMEVLRSHLKAGCKYSAGMAEKLFDYAFDLYLYDPEFYSGPNGTEPLDRQIRAARHLRRYISQDWTVQYGRIYMDQSTMEELQEELDCRIAQASGYAVLQALFRREFQPCYDARLDHFLILRPKRSGSGGIDFMMLPKAAVPANYLIQLALKYITPMAPFYSTPAANIETIVEIARDMMTVLRLSDAESMSDILVPPEQMPDYISDNAQYHSLWCALKYDFASKSRSSRI